MLDRAAARKGSHMENEKQGIIPGNGKREREDRIRAILQYMVKHNDRHAQQLSELCPLMPDDLQDRLRRAVGTFEAATADLAGLLESMNERIYDGGGTGKKARKEETARVPAGTRTHVHVHDPKEKRRQLARLSRVIGHLEYVKRMLEADEDCSDVLIQISASKSALNGLGKQIIGEHIAHCITHAVEEGDTGALDEFKAAIDKYL